MNSTYIEIGEHEAIRVKEEGEKYYWAVATENSKYDEYKEISYSLYLELINHSNKL